MINCSIAILTHKRTSLTKKVLTHNLSNHGIDPSQIELLICDQGSEDQELIEFLKSLNPFYLRLNETNEGVARSLNQLYLRSCAPNFFFMPPDIELPNRWLEVMLSYIDELPMSGVVGFEGQDLILPLEMVNGLAIHWKKDRSTFENTQVFGSTMFTRKLIDNIGGFHEMYHPYGLEDHDICFRSHIAGFMNYYIPGLRSRHLGVDEHNDPKHRIEKEFSFFSNAGLHIWRMKNYWKIGIYEPLPQLRDSI